jgi:membrane associated rhomboid family serine protease
MARSSSFIDRFSFGGRVPSGLGLILALTVACSLVVAFGERHVTELFALTPLVPELVLRGQVWRVVTWVLIEPSPFSLVFRCLLLFWLGRDLSGVWGARRFLSVYFGVCIFAAVATCAVALVDPSVASQTYLGSWALDAAITVAWGLHFPDRVIRIYFVIPIRGHWLAWGTVALTVAYAIYFGWDTLVPVLAAEGGMLAWLFRGRLRSRWLKLRLASVQSQLAEEELKRTVREAREGSERPRPLKPSDLN